MVPISFLLIWACSTTSQHVKYEEHRLESPDTIDGRPADLQNLDENLSNALHCRRRALQFFIQIVILLLMLVVYRHCQKRGYKRTCIFSVERLLRQ